VSDTLVSKLDKAKKNLERIMAAVNELDDFVFDADIQAGKCVECKKYKAMAEDAEEAAHEWELQASGDLRWPLKVLVEGGYISYERGMDLVTDWTLAGHEAAASSLKDLLWKYGPSFKSERRKSAPGQPATLNGPHDTAALV